MEKKIAVVIGGSSGIGQSVAKLLALKEMTVIVASRNQDKGEETVKLIHDSGGDAQFIKTNVLNPDEIMALFHYIDSTYGRLDAACKAAASDPVISLTADTTEETFDDTMNVNVKGVWLCMKHEIRQMLKQKTGGSIVNVSSINGLNATPHASAYGASKHAVEGLTKSAALEYIQSNIRINAVCPGPVKTEMLDRVFGEKKNQAEEGHRKHTPIGRMAHPDEIAKAIVWLISDEASYIVGHSLVVDGGIHAR
jgi:NAD(P)-dependent dehydrogenase (short-subunit alcohol dehydrogenase family)